MKNQDYVDVFSSESMKNAHEDRKMTKFFRWAVPILIIEILVVVALAVFFFIMPKNYCKVSIDMEDAVIYINGKETDKVRLDNPKESVTYYYYAINLHVKLPEGADYTVSFEVNCDKYKIYAATIAPKQDDTYYMTISGGEKTQLITGITIVSEELIKDFDVDIIIHVEQQTQFSSKIANNCVKL